MTARDILMAASGAGAEVLYSDSVFSTYLYTGNGATQTINNGIDLAGEGGLVWSKIRGGASAHHLWDSETDSYLSSDSTDVSNWAGSIPLVLGSNGYLINSSSNLVNQNTATYVSWTFRRAKKFFDIVTYTGNGASNRQIAHELGIAPGFITTKATSTTGDWNSYHRSATGDLKLNLTNAQTASRAIITAADAGTFTVSGVANTNGVQYVAYLFAHDPSEDGIIQCGSFTANASGNATANLGWEPQFVLLKDTNGLSSATGWYALDTVRGLPASFGTPYSLSPNTSGAESTTLSGAVGVTSTGFQITGIGASATYIYLAIRRPNKPPTSGTEVFSVTTQATPAGSITASTGFPVDLVIERERDYATSARCGSRLTGQCRLFTASTAAENAAANYTWASMASVGLTNQSSGYVNSCCAFRRAPGFFDVVCYTGTGVARTVEHGLSVAPELMIVKARSAANAWAVMPIDATQYLSLSSTNAQVASTPSWSNTQPTSTSFTVGTSTATNQSAATYVAYLFASLPGISKVGSYTGNGSNQTIDCGFSTGARFVLIKRTDSTGDWYVWDSARGIVAANDPHLSLNTTVAEVTTDDSVDPDPSGFVVNQVAATNINVSGGSYIFLAIS